MPKGKPEGYKLRKAPKRDLFWVVNKETGKKHSKEPLPKERAQAQMRALYAAESGAVMRGGMDGEEEGYRTPPRARSPAHAGPGRRAPSPPAARALTAAERAAYDTKAVREAVTAILNAEEAQHRLNSDPALSKAQRIRLQAVVRKPASYLPDIRAAAEEQIRRERKVPVLEDMSGHKRPRGSGAAIVGAGEFKDKIEAARKKYFPDDGHYYGWVEAAVRLAHSAALGAIDELGPRRFAPVPEENEAAKQAAVDEYVDTLRYLRNLNDVKMRDAEDERLSRAIHEAEPYFAPGVGAPAPAAARSAPAPAPAPSVTPSTEAARAALKATPSDRKMGFGKEITMKPRDFFKEHKGLVSMLSRISRELGSEAADQAKEAKTVRKKLTGGGAVEAWAAYDALPERPSEEVSVRYVKAFPELGLTESNMMRVYDKSHRRPTPLVAKELIEEALVKKYGERPVGVGKGKHSYLARNVLMRNTNLAEYNRGVRAYHAFMAEGDLERAADMAKRLQSLRRHIAKGDEKLAFQIIPRIAPGDWSGAEPKIGKGEEEC